ncbi:MAG: DUF3536 domain-containing protein [Methanocalculus sp. MSAO_Arc2]|uniref:DUF3536 domain-containing protein n=1 Tax=Methanocalculus sp. MSAO_Arc2 TaxID=2293855 RepID=UPI000FF7DE40|nr:MAG: DUF3536 domain-containing protein [Methanocalculus sp. MSAO_Arc2]
MSRFVCIHGHFYQPPRENPWFEKIEVQDSAYPYHDWNERITAECYAPNTAARILDEDDLITTIVNNYSMISFNAGPTLLSWLERKKPDIYHAIIEADRTGSDRFGGHGPAIAQCYNHMIMPLANQRDKKTQVRWGIRDFSNRFGRNPEGMWLPELAVDLETLRYMAEEGIRYVILEPHQVSKIRFPGGEWMDVSDGNIDFGVPYRLYLGNGEEIAVFINNTQIAHDVAFGPLLRNGYQFSRRLIGEFDNRQTDQIVHFAIDGETYGHHYHFGEMALAYCLTRLLDEGIYLTIYGEYLERNPPSHEIEIREGTSWSCPHNLSRWSGGCTCSTGVHPGWSLQWRGYLREAFDLLRDHAAAHFEHAGSHLFADPWAARDDYIRIINDRSKEARDAYFADHASHALSMEEQVRALQLLEMQRHAMLMYTSCGWFFDDIAGIEAIQVMWYAARALQFYQATGGDDLEEDILAILAQAECNNPEFADGATVWMSCVAPRVTDLRRVCGQYALTSLFCIYPPTSRHTIYEVTRYQDEREKEEERRIAVGAATIRSLLTGESGDYIYAGVHPGGPELFAGVTQYPGDRQFFEIRDTILAAWKNPQQKSMYDVFHDWFEGGCFRLSDLLRDEARGIVSVALDISISRIEDSFRTMCIKYLPLMEVMHDLAMPIPSAITVPVGHVLNADLIAHLGDEIPDPVKTTRLLHLMLRFSIPPEHKKFSFIIGHRLGKLLQCLLDDPENTVITGSIIGLIDVITGLSLQPPLFEAQNAFIHLRDEHLPALRDRAEKDRHYHVLIGQIAEIGQFLRVKV